MKKLYYLNNGVCWSAMSVMGGQSQVKWMSCAHVVNFNIFEVWMNDTSKCLGWFCTRRMWSLHHMWDWIINIWHYFSCCVSVQGLPSETALCEISVVSVKNKWLESWNSSNSSLELKVAKNLIAWQMITGNLLMYFAHAL